jgi:hypothetical protein
MPRESSRIGRLRESLEKKVGQDIQRDLWKGKVKMCREDFRNCRISSELGTRALKR